jgi:hypothetical protein
MRDDRATGGASGVTASGQGNQAQPHAHRFFQGMNHTRIDR